MGAWDTKWDVNKTDETTRREMASSRRVSNDVISQPPLAAQPRSALLWAVAARADVLFGVEQPNEQQAGVRNVAPTALPSYYHTKTYPCVCVCARLCPSISLYDRARASRSLHIAARMSCAFALQTHSQKGTSVMRGEESKSKGLQRGTLRRGRGG